MALYKIKIALEHRLLRAFIVDFHSEKLRKELRRAIYPHLATATREHVLLQLGPVQVHALIDPNGVPSILTPEAAKLKGLVKKVNLAI